MPDASISTWEVLCPLLSARSVSVWSLAKLLPLQKSFAACLMVQRFIRAPWPDHSLTGDTYLTVKFTVFSKVFRIRCLCKQRNWHLIGLYISCKRLVSSSSSSMSLLQYGSAFSFHRHTLALRPPATSTVTITTCTLFGTYSRFWTVHSTDIIKPKRSTCIWNHQNTPNIPEDPFFFLACQPFSEDPNKSTTATATLSYVCRFIASRAI